MKLPQSSFLADENIQPEVIHYLRDRQIDIVSVHELDLAGKPDKIILERASAANRIVITHDADFGVLAVLHGIPFRGILYLRPGHIASRHVIEMIEAVFRQDINVDHGIIVIAQRQHDRVTIRIRR